MRALVTGGAGFIGSHLASALLKRQFRVTVLDDLSSGKLENLTPWNEAEELTIEVGSVNDPALVGKLVDQADLVFHLAAVVGAERVASDPLTTIRTNLMGTGEVLQAAAENDTSVVLVSTSELYNSSNNVPFQEDSPVQIGVPGVGRWSYAMAKAAAEQLALAHAARNGLRVVVPRLFNTVGERQRASHGMVVPRFVDQVCSDTPITVYGDGSQTRCFVDVKDAVGALIALAECPEANGQVVNIGATDEITILELAKTVQALATEEGFRVRPIRFVPYEEVFEPGFKDPARRQPDIRRIQELTGWAPEIQLEETLRRVLDERRSSTSR